MKNIILHSGSYSKTILLINEIIEKIPEWNYF